MSSQSSLKNNNDFIPCRVQTAVHNMWNNQYSEAEHILSTHKATHPRYAIEYANNYLVQSLMSSTNESREVLLELFKSADSLATSAKYNEPMSDDDDDNDDNGVDEEESSNMKIVSKSERKRNKKLFYRRRKLAQKTGASFDETWKLECDIIYADALLMRSIGQLMMNSYLKGGINLRRAWGMYHKMIQDVENDTKNDIPNDMKMCIKYGTGVFYAFLALVPANIMKLLQVIGFISDKELGERYLTEVFESDTIRSPFAALVLCTLYLFLPTGLGRVEETLKKAKHVLDTMNQRYPQNTYFHGYCNFYHRKRGETAEALDEIQKSALNAERESLVPLLIRYLHADTLFMDLRYADAKEKYESVLEHLAITKEKFAYTGQVVLSLAACHVMLGEDNEALEWIKKVKTMYNAKSKNDSNSPTFAARVLSNPQLLPLCGVYMLYINRDLAHMKHEHAERVLKELKRVTKGKDLSGPEAENMYTLFVGVIHKGCGRTEEALHEMGKVFENSKKIPSDSMILPYAYYETGELEYHRGKHEKAKELFIKGQALKGYSNETLANRYNIALKQLKRAMDELK